MYVTEYMLTFKTQSFIISFNVPSVKLKPLTLLPFPSNTWDIFQELHFAD